MKKKELEDKFAELEKRYPYHKVNHTEMFNLQHDTNKLYMEIINDSNEKTDIYNRRLLFYTIVIAFLTVVITILTAATVYQSFKPPCKSATTLQTSAKS